MALDGEPQAFLMDERLSNLDAELRVSIRASLYQLHERLGATTVYVTHDQIEAMTLGHRVAVLRDGLLQQVDTPQYFNVNLRVVATEAVMASYARTPISKACKGRRRRRSGAQRVMTGEMEPSRLRPCRNWSARSAESPTVAACVTAASGYACLAPSARRPLAWR